MRWLLGFIKDRNIWLIYAAIFMVALAYGVGVSLSSIFLDGRGFSKTDIGWFAVSFAAGLCALSVPVGAVIRRWSARGVLITGLLGYAVVVATFPYLPTFGVILAARFFDGAFSVSVWVACETILLSRADEKRKATITSLYALCLALGYVIGPLLALVFVKHYPMSQAFVGSGVVATATAILVALRLDADVADTHGTTETGGVTTSAVPALTILSRIKNPCFATFSYGYFQAAVVLFLPLYLIEQKHVAKDDTILVTAFFAAGMVLFTIVAGWIGDRVGHLATIRGLATLGGLMVLGFVFLDAFPAMLGAVFIAGATLGSISPVSLALQGVVTAHRDLARANGMYNGFYAAGILVGPAVSGRIFVAYGGVAMLYHLAAMWAAFILFTIVFRKDDPRART